LPTSPSPAASDNTLIRSHLAWEPSITLQAGMEQTYAWVYDQLCASQLTRSSAIAA
jgi:GDP-D-mannose 3',5'-epimerase